jgi:hypothetical protein
MINYVINAKIIPKICFVNVGDRNSRQLNNVYVILMKIIVLVIVKNVIMIIKITKNVIAKDINKIIKLVVLNIKEMIQQIKNVIA